MKPLLWVGTGFLLHLVVVGNGGFDLFADPLGWVLVLVGRHRLPRDFPLRDTLGYLGLLALVTSVPLWVPDVAAHLADADPALGWAANLPRFGFTACLCAALTRSAGEAGDRSAAGWWRVLLAGVVGVIVLPVLVFGAGLDGLVDLAAAAGFLVPLAVTLTALWSSDRPWAGAAVVR